MAGRSFLFDCKLFFFKSGESGGNLLTSGIPLDSILEIKHFQAAADLKLGHGPDIETEQADYGLLHWGEGLVKGDTFDGCGCHDGWHGYFTGWTQDDE